MALEFDDTFRKEIPEHDRGYKASDPVPTAKELELLTRRDLALRATDAVSEVLEVDVTVPMLLRLTDATEDRTVQLAAKRALRCIADVGKPDSAVVQVVGEEGIYHFAEAVIQYGARTNFYLDLVAAYGMEAESVTALYDLREKIAEYTNGRKPGFKALDDALHSIGISAHEAAIDPEIAVRALDEAGFFVAYAGNRIFDHPIFAPNFDEVSSRLVAPDEDVDGSLSRGIVAGMRSYFSRNPEESEDESWRQDDNISLKS